MDWYPWGEEALARARDEDRPILLSIGYSACHWCHVMERESFEDAETARADERAFVCIKLDREERPDIDSIYMEACQAMTGSGGWPLNVFLTPEQVPFYAAPTSRPNRAWACRAGATCCEAVAQAWDETRDEIRAGGEPHRGPPSRAAPLCAPRRSRCDEELLDAAVEGLRAQSRRRQRRLRHARRSSRPPPRSSSCCAAASRDGAPRPCARWPRAGCTTRSAAASRATRWTRTGSSPTSRRCSTTTRCSRARTCTAGR